jgi:hypothetical protein
MTTEFQAGTTVRVRGGRFMVLSADLIGQMNGGPIKRLRMRGLDEPFRTTSLNLTLPTLGALPDSSC